jgi:hypothetical protein
MPRRGKATEIADAKWAEDGERMDQDYYRVTGAKNPDRRDPPSAPESVELAALQHRLPWSKWRRFSSCDPRPRDQCFSQC